MKVLKFSGSALSNSHDIERVVNLIVQKSEQTQMVVVVAAMEGVTDQLLTASIQAASKDEHYKELLHQIEVNHLDTIKQLVSVHEQSAILSHCKRQINNLELLLDACYMLGECSAHTSAIILAYGEWLSSYIVWERLKKQIPHTIYKDARELIKTDNCYAKATVHREITRNLIQSYFTTPYQIVVLPGFIAQALDGSHTTLGRGGSDYTAALIAEALHATKLEIWTSFDGMYTANAELVQQAQVISSLTYKEAMELLHFGAKELYPPSIQPVLDSNIPIHIRNIHHPDQKGTRISSEMDESYHFKNPIKGMSQLGQIGLLTIEGSGMIGVAGSSKRIFDALSAQQINVVFITQASSEHSICIGVLESSVKAAEAAINEAFEVEINRKQIGHCVVETNLSILALVGENMKNHQGISGKIFRTLGCNNVNIRAIAQGASERNISIVVDQRDVKKALNSLHECFFEEDIKQLNLFVVGAGNVGEQFIELIQHQQHFLRSVLKINLRLIALCNSKTMLFASQGIDMSQWKTLLAQGEPLDHQTFFDAAKAMNLHNSIFVDNTANAAVAQLYGAYLKNNIAVVTCNKIACSSSYAKYQNLKDLSRKYNAPFLFETNVGAGLPIIDTLKNLIASGDEVHQIQAVLSGSLNFIFNHYDATTSFSEIVKQAGVEGYTEPDPMIDLSGVDVMRKLLILVRESGYAMEMDEIINQTFLPEACKNMDNPQQLLQVLSANEAHFAILFTEAKTKNCRLKYVAQFSNGKATVGIQFIAPDHPFYNLEGKDNIVLFYTKRYADQALQIRGAGAGAAVTASGIFADVIRVVR